MQNFRYYISEIASLIQAKLVSNRKDNMGIATLLTDSRNLSISNNCLFFALETSRNDGHKYIVELYNKGVRNFVVQQIPNELKNADDVNFLVVNNSLKALQTLAKTYRERFSIPIVAITGSNGKTIVKEWLAYLLHEDENVVKSPKSYNSQIGVPLSVWELLPEHDLAIFEAGISQPNEMERNQRVIQPTIGIFTNIGTAHDEHFISRSQKISEKLKLFSDAQLLIYSTDYSEITKEIEANEILCKTPTFTWGHNKNSTLQILSVNTNGATTSIDALYKNEKIAITIPFSDKASIENALHCWAFLLSKNMPQATIAAQMKRLPIIEMRMELKEAINNCSVINDSYSSDYYSLQIAVDFLNSQQQHAKKTVILSDILQSGRNENELYAEIARLLGTKNIHRIIGIGAEISRQADKFSIAKSFYPDTETFLQTFDFATLHNETILLKGARIFAFEKINKRLQQKAHETILEIDLNALTHNLNYYRAKLNAEVRVMAMVKAFSYGSGSYEIANLLQFHRVDYLTVAYADEGVELRKAGIGLPIMVMNPEEQSLDAMLDYNLEPEVYSFRILSLLKQKLTNDKSLAIHIKCDTGMHRLGFEENEIPQLVAELATTPTLRVASVFSHLAAADNPELDDFTRSQISTFRRMSEQIQSIYKEPIYKHILNSAGISRFPDAQFDMVRLGIGLYGIGHNDDEQQYLQNVSTLKTVISQIKNLASGDTVGYNRAYVAKQNMRVATIPIGYADGLNRKFGNGNGHVLINGKKASVIGNVCMDMCMIDITNIDAKENDEVIIFGAGQPISEVAKVLDTIPYEVLTGISRRVKRVYFQE